MSCRGMFSVMAVLSACVAANAVGAELVAPSWIQYEAGPTIHGETADQVFAADDGTITTVGSAWLPETGQDVLVARYASDGTPIWSRRIDSPEHGSDEFGNAALAPDGGLWISVQHLATEPRMEVVRLDSDGEIVWNVEMVVEPFNGVFSSQLAPRLAVDLEHGAPRIYVTVSDAGAYRVMRLSDDGMIDWNTTWTSNGLFGDAPAAITVGVNGDVYVTGRQDGVSAYATIGLSPAGQLVFAHEQPGAIGSVLTDPLVAAYPTGGVIVAGSPETMCGTFEIRLWRIDDEGAELWDVIFGAQPCGTSFGPTALDVAPDGRIAVAAACVFDVGWLTVMLNDTGAPLWSRQWLNPNSSGDVPYAIAFDAFGGIVVTGMHQAQPSLDAFGAIRYARNGANLVLGSGEPDIGPAGRSIAIGADNAIFIAGRNWGGPMIGERATTQRFDPPPPPIKSVLQPLMLPDGGELNN